MFPLVDTIRVVQVAQGIFHENFPPALYPACLLREFQEDFLWSSSVHYVCQPQNVCGPTSVMCILMGY